MEDRFTRDVSQRKAEMIEMQAEAERNGARLAEPSLWERKTEPTGTSDEESTEEEEEEESSEEEEGEEEGEEEEDSGGR